MLRKYFRDETGATATEYGLIAALIAVALIAGATLVGDSIDGIFNTVTTCLLYTSPSPRDRTRSRMPSSA